MGAILPHKAGSGKQISARKCQRRLDPKSNQTHFMEKVDICKKYTLHANHIWPKFKSMHVSMRDG
jgi:hypothetical protein